VEAVSPAVWPQDFPPEFDEWQSAGGAFAGTPEGARAYIEQQTETAATNYFVCDISFGDLTLQEAMRTVELMAREVMPAFRDRGETAGMGQGPTVPSGGRHTAQQTGQKDRVVASPLGE
jgi:hypothetical protein